MDLRQSVQRDLRQRAVRRLQHAADPTARRRPRADGAAAGRLAWRFARIERYGFLILIGLLLVSFFADDLGLPFILLEEMLWPPIEGLMQLIGALTGWPGEFLIGILPQEG